MVLLDDEALVDRCLTLRRWGRRSEPQLFGSRKGERHFFSDVDGIEYDNLFIFDEIGWNFEPSELSAAFGRVQLSKLPRFLERRKRNFARLCEPARRATKTRSRSPRTTPGSTPAGTCSRSGFGSSRVCAAASCSSGWRAAASTRAWCGAATSCASPRSRRSRTARRPTACRTPIA
jgi:hypothetical protein